MERVDQQHPYGVMAPHEETGIAQVSGLTGFWTERDVLDTVHQSILETVLRVRRQQKAAAMVQVPAPPGTRWPDHDDGDEGKV